MSQFCKENLGVLESINGVHFYQATFFRSDIEVNVEKKHFHSPFFSMEF